MIITDLKSSIERIKEMPHLKREMMMKLFTYLKDKRDSDRWRHFKGEFRYDDKDYVMECDVRMDNEMLTYRHLHIEHKQVEINVDDLIRRGMIN